MGKVVKHDFNNGCTVDFGNLTKEEILRRILQMLESAEYAGKEIKIRIESYNYFSNNYVPVIMSFNDNKEE